MLESLDLSQIEDAAAREVIRQLLNLVEELTQENRALREETQRLRDEINRLKGEQGQARFKPKRAVAQHSSEQERQTPQPRQKRPPRAEIHVDREEILRVDRAQLPADAEFKGYDEVVVQDVVFRTDNVRFRKEVFYSPSAGQRYCARLPAGYQGAFGPGIKALAIVLYYGGLMSEPKIGELFANVGVSLSTGELSNLLVKEQAAFHAEAEQVFSAGVASSPWQHMDETGTKVNGEQHHCHILCNPLYTSYQTTAGKDRLSVIDVLRHGRARQYLVNEEGLGYLAHFRLSVRLRTAVAAVPRDQAVDETTFQRWLDTRVGPVGPQQRRWILDSCAIAAYQAQLEVPVVRLLLTDDAPQWTLLTEDLALCWVHEGRHSKKLTPALAQHRALLDDFLTPFWDFYRELLAYRQAPDLNERDRLAGAFDTLFATTTGYRLLDERIATPRTKKAELLLVLEHPELPLHNNPAELGARARVRKRDVSFGPRTADGARAWDTFQSLAATAKKLGVSFFHSIHDRVSQTNQMPSLAEVIAARAQDLDLGASWNSS